MAELKVTRLVRGEDWPPELRAACDEMEHAADRLVNVRWGSEFEPAGLALDKARLRFGALLRKLDMERRPEIYGLDP